MGPTNGLPGLPIDFFFNWEHGQRYLFKPCPKLGQELPKQKELRIAEAEPTSPSSSKELRGTLFSADDV